MSKDVPPFVKAVGNPIKLYGLNSIGSEAQRIFAGRRSCELKRAYRLFFSSELNLSQARERAERGARADSGGRQLLSFVESSERGVAI